MRQVKIAALVAVLIISTILLVALLFSSGDDIVKEEYKDYAAALAADAKAHGMVPDFLPKSAVNILSLRNLDLNYLVVEFSFNSEDFDVFLGTQKVRRLPADYVVPSMPKGRLVLSNSSELVVIDPVETKGEFSQGVLIVNLAQRRALFSSRNHK